MSSQSPFIRLRCAVQPYPYGKIGSNSTAARFAAATPENNFEIDEKQPYGEIWMGDHPNGAAHTVSDNKPLKSLIEENPSEYLSPGVHKRFHGDTHLPFLFKVLSFDKALPLQAHPDRSLAERLKNQEAKENDGKNESFVDPNHKPEVAVTISDSFEGFVGFRPIAELKSFLTSVPELRKAIGDEAAIKKLLDGPEEGKEAEASLKKLFSDLLGKDQKFIGGLTEELLHRIETEGDAALGPYGKKQYLGPIVQKILRTYPGDIGMFVAVFFMNFCRLKKGEGIAVPADCIHAYLEGDVIECMAWSDNMIACGFMPESERNDPKVFVDMLLYQPSESKKLELKHSTWSKSGRGKTEFYDVPMDEFDLLHTVLEGGEEEVVSEGINGPAVFVVTSGAVSLSRSSPGADHEGEREEVLKTGQVVFVKPGTGYQFKAVAGNAEVWGSFVEA